MYDVIIVGAGPAGLTAAIYTCRAEKKTLVLEAVSYGGQIINTRDIENYPAAMHISGYDLATKMYEQAMELGAEMKFERVIKIRDDNNDDAGVKTVVTSDGEYQARAVILATGAENRKLGLPGEEELTGRGVSYCATCDGAFYKGRVVAVQGGGNTALDDVVYLADIAEKVYLVHRRDEFRADAKLVEQVQKLPNVEMVLGYTVGELIAGEDGKLRAIKVGSKAGDERELEVAGLFVAIGQVPETENFADTIKTDAVGYIDAGEDCLTGIPGIFVAGDCRVKGVRQLVTATGDGAVAAMAAVGWLNRG